MPLIDFNKTVPYVKKKGLAGFFQLITHNFFDLILLNILFIFTSLPIITIGSSLMALNKMTLNMVKDVPTSFCKDYFYFFKKYFWDGMLSGALFAVLFATVGFSFYYYLSWARQESLMYIPSIILFSCLLILAFIAIFYFPMYCSVDLKKRVIFKNSFFLSISFFKNSIAAFLVIFIFALLIACFFPYSIPFICLGPISFSALAACYAAWKPIKDHAILKGDKPV